jgi:hypothetical protein
MAPIPFVPFSQTPLSLTQPHNRRIKDGRIIQRMSQFLTTEHFTLQGARNGTISEANGRLGHYLSAVGSGLVALAFVADTSQLETLFLVFSAVIFPIQIILGAVTLTRTIQIGVNDARLARAINRIRLYYLKVAPEAEPYFSYPQYDDHEAVLKTMMPFHSPLQGLASTPGPIILVNSVLAGVFTGIVAVGFFSMRLIPGMISGGLRLAFAFALHMLYASRIWQRGTRMNMEVRFPTPQQ